MKVYNYNHICAFLPLYASRSSPRVQSPSCCFPGCINGQVCLSVCLCLSCPGCVVLCCGPSTCSLYEVVGCGDGVPDGQGAGSPHRCGEGGELRALKEEGRKVGVAARRCILWFKTWYFLVIFYQPF